MPEPEKIDVIIDKCMYFIKDKVTFGLCVDTRIPVIVETKPEVPDDVNFLCFYGSVKPKDLRAIYADFEPIRKRVMELTTVPPTHPEEFSPAQLKVIETVAHDVRSRACLEKNESKRTDMFVEAFMIYAGAAIASEVSFMKCMMKTILDDSPPLKTLSRVVDDAHTQTKETKRLFSHVFAGMAMCALMGRKSVRQFYTCSTAAIAQSSRDAIKLSHTLRALLLLYASNSLELEGFEVDSESKGFFTRFSSAEAAASFMDQEVMRELPGVHYQLTKAVIVPLLLRKGKGSMIEQERKLIHPSDWEKTISHAKVINKRDLERAAGDIPLPVGKTVTVHFVNGKPIERICVKCGKGTAQAGKLFRCSRCMSVYYCSLECQGADWDAHKPGCKRQDAGAR